MAKSPKQPFKKGRGKCIFCGGFGMSKEHIWADWLKQYIPRDMLKNKLLSMLVFPDRQKNKEIIETRSGDPRSRRLKVVCEKCNNGWMSKLQERAKPFLVPMLKGENVSFYKNGQTTLGAWVAMFVMVAEFLDKDKISISDQERAWFMKNKRPPSHWRIWIGRYERSTRKNLWFHNVLTFIKDESEAVTDGSVPTSNTQTSTILLGKHLVIHVMSSPIARRIVKRWRHTSQIAPMMREIWPTKERIVAWPPEGVLTEDDVEIMANHFFLRCDAVVRKREGII